MRQFLFVGFLALLATPTWVSGQGTAGETPKPAASSSKVEATPKDATEPECRRTELVILGKNDGQKPIDFIFEMGESFRIKATGGCNTKIRDVVKPGGSNALALYFDGVHMTGLTPFASEPGGGKELYLDVPLTREASEEKSRDEWDMLFQKKSSYLMTIEPALAIGGDLPISVAKPFQFQVAPAGRILLTLAVCLAILVIAFYILASRGNALRNGDSGLYSLGKSQMAFWGLLVVLTFAGVWFLTGTMEFIPPQVLILLGISGATGLSAVVIGTSKKAKTQSRLGELERQQSKGFWRDICDDGNGLSFHRLQVVIWTLVLGAVWIRSVADVMSMPEFSETLLTLLGISNATYLGFKFPENS